jgi:phage host-nuclease inhibitor protein Gam
MAKRRSVKAPALKSWQEVDEALREIGESEIKLEEIDGEVTRQCNEIKDKYAPQSQSINARIRERTGQIEDFVEAHRDDFGEKKTRLLNFGETGWRQSTSIVIPKGKEEIDEIIRRLRAREMNDCVVVSEKIDKDGSFIDNAPLEWGVPELKIWADAYNKGVPVLYIIGMLVRHSGINNTRIPLLLGVVGVVLATVWVLATSSGTGYQNVLLAVFTAIVQGVLCTGAAVYVNQLIKQNGKDE